jgi:predicted NACHT family NTPase
MELKLIIEALNFFKEPILDGLSDIKGEVTYILNNGIKKYLMTQSEKYSETRTFLHRYKKLDFYSIYFHVSLSDANRNIIHTNSLKKILDLNSYINIIGTAGSGKSMMIKHFFQNAISEKKGIPILIELRHLNDKKISLDDYIQRLFEYNNIVPDLKFIDRILSSGKFIFLFDAYDEIFSINKIQITQELISFMDKYHTNKFILTSRPNAGSEMLPRFINLGLKSLNDYEINSFVQQQVSIYDSESELSNRIIKSIENPTNKNAKAFVRNPLLLSMFILTYENNPEIPRKRSQFYSNIFNALCYQHDSLSKYGFIHEKKSKLSNDDIEQLLMLFSFITFFKGTYSFSYSELKSTLQYINKNSSFTFESDLLIEDLGISISILLQDGLEYKFPHRSMQEFFAAKFISNLKTEKKENIYLEKLPAILQQSNDNYYNFLQMCEEIDKTDFTTKFLINTINSFESHVLNQKGEKSLLFLELLDLEFIIEVDYSSWILGGGGRDDAGNLQDTVNYDTLEYASIVKSFWNEKFNIYKVVFTYLKCFSIHEIISALNPNDIVECMDDITRSDKIGYDPENNIQLIRVNIINELKEDCLIRMLAESDLGELLESIIQRISEKKKKLQKSLLRESNFLDDLLTEI